MDEGVVVENLFENYWFLDSFGADSVLETRTVVECRFWDDFPLFNKACGKCLGWMGIE